MGFKGVLRTDSSEARHRRDRIFVKTWLNDNN